MVGASYYRAEAERCRKRAAEDPKSDMAKRWLQLAAEYEQLAEAMGQGEDEKPSTQRSPMQQQPMQQQPMQQQPMQQQQSKTGNEDET